MDQRDLLETRHAPPARKGSDGRRRAAAILDGKVIVEGEVLGVPETANETQCGAPALSVDEIGCAAGAVCV